MKKTIFSLLLLCPFLICTRCAEDYSEYTVYNETDKNILVLTKNEFNTSEGKINLIRKNNMSDQNKRQTYSLDERFLNLFSFKTFLLSLNDYKENEELIPNKGITFYFINEENFKKPYNIIRTEKLYDSIFVARNDYHNMGADNYIHKYNDTIIFKSY